MIGGMQYPSSMHAAGAPTPVGLDGAARVSAIVDLLLTVGYIDGLFHRREQDFITRYLDSVILMVEQSTVGTDDDRARLGMAWRGHFEQVYQQLSAEIAGLSAEVTAAGGDGYVPTRLKVRALSLFRGLPVTDQPVALELVQALMQADGMISPPERGLHDELLGYFAAPAPALTSPAIATPRPRPIVVHPPQWNDLKALSHPLLDPLEQTLSPHPIELQSQVARDFQLVNQAIAVWTHQRAVGQGRLTGITDIGQLPPGARFLDGHVHVMRPSQPVELVVLGDLHGCYSCLKAALLQSDFIRRVWLHQWDPARHPDVKLVILGDYIDRGRFSFDGVLRTVLQLMVTLPDHVVLLRGNHEYFVWLDHQMVSGVHPAEALSSIAPYVPAEMLEAYRLLFEHMPTSFIVDRTLFVHGGIPRDDMLETRYRDLSSLNDNQLRFQMMWSDPTPTDHVPVELQRQNPRFNFGRQQFRAFMDRIGCKTMIRGHEWVEHGFEIVYDLGDHLLLNLFSAGGHDNRDLPAGAPYRKVTPMALTFVHGHGPTQVIPWPIHYQPFNYEPYNGLHRTLPLLEFRYT
jgi:hypothetical protein